MAHVLMARFDVYQNAGVHIAKTPYLLDRTFCSRASESSLGENCGR
jgi:hypothetical protein